MSIAGDHITITPRVVVKREHLLLLVGRQFGTASDVRVYLTHNLRIVVALPSYDPGTIETCSAYPHVPSPGCVIDVAALPAAVRVLHNTLGATNAAFTLKAAPIVAQPTPCRKRPAPEPTPEPVTPPRPMMSSTARLMDIMQKRGRQS